MQPLLDDGYQDVDRDGDPHLRLHGVLESSEERLDPQVLLDPPEEQFHLPPLLAEPADPDPETRHTYHMLTILIDEEKSGIGRDALSGCDDKSKHRR
jgi:hypothetical protein